MKKIWRLIGYDTFSNEWYDLDGSYRSLAAVEKAAQKRLELLEQRQPSASSGGQAELGIQDRVFIETPEGRRYRWEGKCPKK